MFFCEKSEKLNQLCTAFVLNTSAWTGCFVGYNFVHNSSATNTVFNRDTVRQVAKLRIRFLQFFAETAQVWPESV
jgi:hypothetical protein